MQLHPLMLLLSLLSGIVAIQCAPYPLIPFLLTTSAALVWGRSGFLRLLSKSRWLLLAMVITSAWLTPGTELSGWGGHLGLTAEGYAAAHDHLLSFLSMIGLIALLLARLDSEDMVLGIYFLLAPLAAFGLERGRLAVRLMLTLRLSENRRGVEGDGQEVLVNRGERIVLTPTAWSVADTSLLGIMLLMQAAAFLA